MSPGLGGIFISSRPQALVATPPVARKTLTSALLGKHQVGLLGSRQIRHTVTSVEQVRALVFWQLGVFSDFQRLVMSEATADKKKKNHSVQKCFLPSRTRLISMVRWRGGGMGERKDTYLSSWNTISQPPSSLMLFPGRAFTLLLTI